MPHFIRTVPAPLVTGGYQGYREYVRTDFCHRCAYCLMAELFAAGRENFELDHFQPKSRFLDREQDFYNLYYACHPCNMSKHDFWPPKDLEDRGLTSVFLKMVLASEERTQVDIQLRFSDSIVNIS